MSNCAASREEIFIVCIAPCGYNTLNSVCPAHNRTEHPDMDLPIFQIDAFTSTEGSLFSGNAAAVVPLHQWLSDAEMLAIAAENNLSETSFFVRQTDGTYAIRWFTPTAEVDLCGHATLAAAHVIHQVLGDERDELPLTCGVGNISVTVIDGESPEYELNFPNRAPEPLKGKRLLNQVAKALGVPVVALHQSRDLIAELADAETLKSCQPDFSLIKALDIFGLAITAPGDSEGLDFVCRFFAPQQGIDEDPVTGSAYCSLAPLWAERLEKHQLSARQCSQRGGDVSLTVREDTVGIRGTTFHYMQGVIRLPD